MKYSKNLNLLLFMLAISIFFVCPQEAFAQSDPGPPLNADELDVYSRILAKARASKLTNKDLAEFDNMLAGYTQRTGRYLSKKEWFVYIGVMELTTKYYYELMQSTLYSWDRRKVFTTNEFDKLHKEMKKLGLRKKKLMKEDLESLKAASRNQPYILASDGNRYQFSREIILQELKNIDLPVQNNDRLSKIFLKFVR